ncbi:NADP-dependent 3-hydroxy acid dehydrogenase YdfG [Chitinophaga rupis]|uniref:NADP-dependent 3-hydroxy acid dehydrogenase YdfG n=1 Tax=Chitinophaga rupis TaxID=573321 RepID=A0A1H7ZN36_9BACT|nr:SDR family oxidoreductase [Chitinophaga rupis]SEM58867.1 NADP-dependent 3-hydroxy acid dehydrogenase YdfG [Chitinophaga rupis]
MESLQTAAYNEQLTGAVTGRTVVVTGGTTGIGRATAILLARQGADVLIAGQDPQHLTDTLNSAGQEELKGSLTGIVTDLSGEEGINKLFNEADNHFKKLDVLVNCAALAYQGIADGSYADWQKVVNTNLLAYMACTRQAIDRMRPNKEGHIINIGSMSADVREKNSSVYVATKAAIQGFSESVRKEINEMGIKVTLIEPGAVGTDMQPVSVPDQQQKEEDLEMLKAEDIAAAVLYTIMQPKRCDVVDIKIRPHLQII